MKSIKVWSIIPVLCVLLAGCGSGGQGAGSGHSVTPASPTGASATLKVSVAGVSLPMSGIKATLTLPAGVAVAVNADGSFPAGTVVPSGLLDPASAALVPGSVTFDASLRQLSFILYSTTQDGFTAGEFASVACLLSGATPAAGDFSALLEPVDLSGNTLTGAGVSASFLLAP